MCINKHTIEKKLVENKTVRLEIQKYEYEMRKTEFKTIMIID